VAGASSASRKAYRNQV